MAKSVLIKIIKTNTILTIDKFCKYFCKSINYDFVGDIYESVSNPGEYIITDAFGKFEYIDPTLFEVVINEDNNE